MKTGLHFIVLSLLCGGLCIAATQPARNKPRNIVQSACPRLLADFLWAPISEEGVEIPYHSHLRSFSGPPPVNIVPFPDEMFDPAIQEMMRWMDFSETDYVYFEPDEWRRFLNEIPKLIDGEFPSVTPQLAQTMRRERFINTLPVIRSLHRATLRALQNRALNAFSRKSVYRIPIWYVSMRARAVAFDVPLRNMVRPYYLTYTWFKDIGVKPNRTFSESDIAAYPVQQSTKEALRLFLSRGGTFVEKHMSVGLSNGVIVDRNNFSVGFQHTGADMTAGFNPSENRLYLAPLTFGWVDVFMEQGRKGLEKELDTSIRHELGHAFYHQAKVRKSKFVAEIFKMSPTMNLREEIKAIAQEFTNKGTLLSMQDTLRNSFKQFLVGDSIIEQLQFMTDKEIVADILASAQLLRPETPVPPSFEASLLLLLQEIRSKTSVTEVDAVAEKIHLVLIKHLRGDLDYRQEAEMKVRLYLATNLSSQVDELIVRQLVEDGEEIDQYKEVDSRLTPLASKLVKSPGDFLLAPESYMQSASLLKGRP